MNEPEFDELPPTSPVRPQRSARAALPGLAGVLAGGVLLGFTLGLAAVPQGKQNATPPPGAVTSPVPSLDPGAAPSATVELPPADALTLPAALRRSAGTTAWASRRQLSSRRA